MLKKEGSWRLQKTKFLEKKEKICLQRTQQKGTSSSVYIRRHIYSMATGIVLAWHSCTLTTGIWAVLAPTCRPGMDQPSRQKLAAGNMQLQTMQEGNVWKEVTLSSQTKFSFLHHFLLLDETSQLAIELSWLLRIKLRGLKRNRRSNQCLGLDY